MKTLTRFGAIESTQKLFVSILGQRLLRRKTTEPALTVGQSNARNVSSIYESYSNSEIFNRDTSGATFLQEKLDSLVDNRVITGDDDETNFSVDASIVYSDSFSQNDSRVWWYPDRNLPGGALKTVEQRLKNWLAENEAQTTDEIAIIWQQGEADALRNRSSTNPLDREEYKQSLTAVFDYLSDSLNQEKTTFYILPIGRFQSEAAINRGWSLSDIKLINEGRDIVKEVQAEIALERDDIQLTSSYEDLRSLYEEGQLYGEEYEEHNPDWSTDLWQVGHDEIKVNSDRIAQYIAVDRGESNVISYVDSSGEFAESISLSRDGLLDLNISAQTQRSTIQGTEAPDVIVGTIAADRIVARLGDDVIVASSGNDTITGGEGNDVFFFKPLDNNVSFGDNLIRDFEPNRDRLDISELLNQAEYTGNEPIEDGYIKISSVMTDSLAVQFDSDGIGENSPTTLAILENVDPMAFQEDISSQFITIPTEF